MNTLQQLQQQLNSLPEDTKQLLLDKLKGMELGDMSLTNTWWSLPKSLQNQLQKLTKGKTKWTTTLYKMQDNQDWYLSLPQLMTYNESLTYGTEKTLDLMYTKLTGEQPTSNSKLLSTWSSEPLPDGNCTLTYQGDDDLDKESSYYLCEETQTLCWLCPYLQWLMGEKPQKLYLKLTPTK
jgi:hypothetical protein